MLDFAKIQPDGSQFNLELAVPLEFIKERLSFCRDERKATDSKSTEVQP